MGGAAHSTVQVRSASGLAYRASVDLEWIREA
jgi:hypothetical protein